MADRRKTETEGGDTARHDRQQQGAIANDSATINIKQLYQNFAALESPKLTGDEPPNNLPYGRDRIFGREAALKALDDRLERCDRVAVTSVAGMGGVGKSELAVQYARRALSQRYRGGAVWLSAQRAGIELLNFAKTRFFPQADFSQLGDLKGQLDFVWSHWPEPEAPPGSVLLIFDDVTDYRQQVKALLPSDTRFRVLVTTRQRIQGIDRLDLEILAPGDALALLRSILRASNEADPRAADETQLAAICEWLGYLPLGVELVGHYLERKPSLSLEALRERLQEKRLVATALVDEPDAISAERNVAAALELSWEAASAEAGGVESEGVESEGVESGGVESGGAGEQELAMRLSLFAAAPIPWDLVQGCWPEMKGEALEDWRDRLVELNLVQDAKKNRYALHPLIREFFAAKLRAAGVEQVVAWRRSFAAALTQVARQIPQTATLEQRARVREAIPHMEAATEYSDLLGSEDDEWSWPFEGLARYYAAQRLFDSAERYRQKCLKASETRFGSDRTPTAKSLNSLAILYQSQEKYEAAEPLFQRASNIHERQLGANHPDTVASLSNLAELYRLRGKYKEAVLVVRRALEIHEQKLGADHLDIVPRLNSLAALYCAQENYEEAARISQRALEIREQKLGAEHPFTAISCANLSLLYCKQARWSKAEPLMVRARLTLSQSLGESHPQSQAVLQNLFDLIDAARRSGCAEELSDHPLTQQLLAQLSNQASSPYFRQRYR